MNNASESSNTQIRREFNDIMGNFGIVIRHIRQNYGVFPDRNEEITLLNITIDKLTNLLSKPIHSEELEEYIRNVLNGIRFEAHVTRSTFFRRSRGGRRRSSLRRTKRRR